MQMGELTLQMPGKDHFPPAHPCLSWRLPVQTVATRTGRTGRPTIYLIKQNSSTRRMTTQDTITIASKLPSSLVEQLHSLSILQPEGYSNCNIFSINYFQTEVALNRKTETSVTLTWTQGDKSTTITNDHQTPCQHPKWLMQWKTRAQSNNPRLYSISGPASER